MLNPQHLLCLVSILKDITYVSTLICYLLHWFANGANCKSDIFKKGRVRGCTDNFAISRMFFSVPCSLNINKYFPPRNLSSISTLVAKRFSQFVLDRFCFHWSRVSPRAELIHGSSNNLSRPWKRVRWPYRSAPKQQQCQWQGLQIHAAGQIWFTKVEQILHLWRISEEENIFQI